MQKLMILIGAVATSLGLYAADYAMTVEGKEGGYNSFKAAIEAAKDGALITLHDNVASDYSSQWTLSANQKVNINLNGFTLSHDHRTDYFVKVGGAGASMSLSNGTIKVGYIDSYPYGMKLEKGLKLTFSDAQYFCKGGPALVVMDGSSVGVYNKSKVRGDATSVPAVQLRSTTLNIDKDSIISSAAQAIEGYGTINSYGTVESNGSGVAVEGNTGTVFAYHFYDGARVTSANGFAIYAKGTSSASVTIDGGAEIRSSGNAAITLESSCKLTVNDGATVSGKSSAVSITGAGVTADIKGGTITATSGKAVSVSGNSTLTGFISGGEFKGTQAMPADYIAPKAGYESRWVDAATAGYVTPGYVRVFNVTYTTAHGEAPAVKTVYPTLVDDDQYEYALTAADLPTLPDADGYVFKGWCIDSQKVEVGTVISGDVSLTASWELATVAFTVSWDGTAKISKAYAKVGAAEKSEIQNGAAIQVIPGTVVTLSADFTENWIKCPELMDYTVDAATAVTLTTTKIDPSSDITPDTKAADVGITDGAFKEMTGAELGRVVGWAESKGFSPIDLNKVAFDADGDATTREAEAYLLNCSAAELEQAKANFKVTAITQNDDGSWTVEVNGKQFNGVVEKVPVEDITVTNGELYRAALRFKPSND